MPEYQVCGADRVTRQQRVVTVGAESPSDAENLTMPFLTCPSVVYRVDDTAEGE